MSTRSLTSFAAVLTIAGAAVAQDRLETFPGYESYESLRRLTPASGGTITDVRWSEDDASVTFDRDGETFRFVFADRSVHGVADEEVAEEADEARPRGARRRGPGRGRQRDRETSPDGAWEAACVDWNVVIEAVSGDEVVRVTTDGSRKYRFGTASWVYGEELDQNDAMWWSPDSRRLVFYAFDERDVPDYFITSGLTELRTSVLQEGYPKPGDANPVVSLMSYDMATGASTLIETATGPDQYVYNIRFTPGGKLLYSRTNRHQNHLEVTAVDLDSGRQWLVVEERQEAWQKNRPTMQFLEDGHRFIWETERSGWKRYELRDLEGSLLAELSDDGFPSRSIVRVDEDAGWFYYVAASGDNPLDDHLHRVRLDGSERSRLTSDPLHHGRFDISPGHRWFICRQEAIDTPPRTVLRDMSGNVVATLAESDTSAMDELGLQRPELFTFTAADGVTTLYGVLHKPANFDPGKSWPLVVDVYGGPLSRGLRNTWSPVRPECELGFLVAKLENRGTVDRGKAFESAAYLKLGEVDIADQVAGVRHLASRPYVDGERVGIFGHSYGGYMAALAVLKHPDVFAAAVAGAPVTDWRNYDSIYTERFMRTPAENGSGYDEGSCLEYVDRYEGGLLLMHGMVDDNVHPSNTWQLVDRLQREGKQFEMMLYPRSGHGLGATSSRLRWEFLWDRLIGGR